MSFTNPNVNQKKLGGHYLPYSTLGGYNYSESECHYGVAHMAPSYSAPRYEHGGSNGRRGSNYSQLEQAYGCGAGDYRAQYSASICQ